MDSEFPPPLTEGVSSLTHLPSLAARQDGLAPSSREHDSGSPSGAASSSPSSAGASCSLPAIAASSVDSVSNIPRTNAAGSRPPVTDHAGRGVTSPPLGSEAPAQSVAHAHRSLQQSGDSRTRLHSSLCEESPATQPISGRRVEPPSCLDLPGVAAVPKCSASSSISAPGPCRPSVTCSLPGVAPQSLPRSCSLSAGIPGSSVDPVTTVQSCPLPVTLAPVLPSQWAGKLFPSPGTSSSPPSPEGLSSSLSSQNAQLPLHNATVATSSVVPHAFAATGPCTSNVSHSIHVPLHITQAMSLQQALAPHQSIAFRNQQSLLSELQLRLQAQSACLGGRQGPQITVQLNNQAPQGPLDTSPASRQLKKADVLAGGLSEGSQLFLAGKRGSTTPVPSLEPSLATQRAAVVVRGGQGSGIHQCLSPDGVTLPRTNGTPRQSTVVAQSVAGPAGAGNPFFQWQLAQRTAAAFASAGNDASDRSTTELPSEVASRRVGSDEVTPTSTAVAGDSTTQTRCDSIDMSTSTNACSGASAFEGLKQAGASVSPRTAPGTLSFLSSVQCADESGHLRSLTSTLRCRGNSVDEEGRTHKTTRASSSRNREDLFPGPKDGLHAHAPSVSSSTGVLHSPPAGTSVLLAATTVGGKVSGPHRVKQKDDESLPSNGGSLIRPQVTQSGRVIKPRPPVVLPEDSAKKYPVKNRLRRGSGSLDSGGTASRPNRQNTLAKAGRISCRAQGGLPVKGNLVGAAPLAGVLSDIHGAPGIAQGRVVDGLALPSFETLVQLQQRVQEQLLLRQEAETEQQVQCLEALSARQKGNATSIESMQLRDFMIWPPGMAMSSIGTRKVRLFACKNRQAPVYLPRRVDVSSVTRLIKSDSEGNDISGQDERSGGSPTLSASGEGGQGSREEQASVKKRRLHESVGNKDGRELSGDECGKTWCSAFTSPPPSCAYLESMSASGFLVHWYTRQHVAARLYSQVRQIEQVRRRLESHLSGACDLHTNLFYFSLFPEAFSNAHFHRNLGFFPQYAVLPSVARQAGLRPLSTYRDLSSSTALVAELKLRAKLQHAHEVQLRESQEAVPGGSVEAKRGCGSEEPEPLGDNLPLTGDSPQETRPQMRRSSDQAEGGVQAPREIHTDDFVERRGESNNSNQEAKPDVDTAGEGQKIPGSLQCADSAPCTTACCPGAEEESKIEAPSQSAAQTNALRKDSRACEKDGCANEGGSTCAGAQAWTSENERRSETSLIEARYLPALPRLGLSRADMELIASEIKLAQELLLSVGSVQMEQAQHGSTQERKLDELPWLVLSLPAWFESIQQSQHHEVLAVMTARRLFSPEAWEGRDKRSFRSVIPFAARALLATAICRLEHFIASLQQELAVSVASLQLLKSSLLVVQQIENHYAPAVYATPQHVLACLYHRGGYGGIGSTSLSWTADSGKKTGCRNLVRGGSVFRDDEARDTRVDETRERPESSENSATHDKCGGTEQATGSRDGWNDGTAEQDKETEEGKMISGLNFRPAPRWEAGIRLGPPVLLSDFSAYVEAFEDYLPVFMAAPLPQLSETAAEGDNEKSTDIGESPMNLAAGRQSKKKRVGTDTHGHPGTSRQDASPASTRKRKTGPAAGTVKTSRGASRCRGRSSRGSAKLTPRSSRGGARVGRGRESPTRAKKFTRAPASRSSSALSPSSMSCPGVSPAVHGPSGVDNTFGACLSPQQSHLTPAVFSSPECSSVLDCDARKAGRSVDS